MSSIETLRDHPRRLSAAAYAPFGVPIDLPPVWDGPPLSSLTRMTAGSRLTYYMTYDSSPTPPPAYSDDGGDYDRHVFFDDEDEFDEEEDLAMAIAQSRNQSIHQYDDMNRHAVNRPRVNIRDIADRVSELEIEAAVITQHSSTGIDPQDLVDRLIVAAESISEDIEDPESDIEVSASALSSPEVIKSSTETPELHEEGWSFPSPQIRRDSIMRVRDPLPAPEAYAEPENNMPRNVARCRVRERIVPTQEAEDMREMYRLMTAESRPSTPPIPRRPTGQVPRLIAPFIPPAGRPIPPRHPLEMVRTSRISEISPNLLSTDPASAPAAFSLSRLKPLPPLPHAATLGGLHHRHVLGPRARHLAPETPYSRSQPSISPLDSINRAYRL